MGEVRIYGSSDDLIEVDGDISEEFNHYYDDDDTDPVYLSFSDGTLLSVYYDKQGIWRITRLAAGSAGYEKREGIDPNGDEYTDRVTLTGDLKWVLYADKGQFVKAG